MSDHNLADALARLQEHRDLHLPLRRHDLLGRLALRFLWKRQLKWQVEANLATRDAVAALSAGYQRLAEELAELAGRTPDGRNLVTREDLRAELSALHGALDALRRSDQNIMAGLNQRIYSLVGGLRTELSDLRLQLAEKAQNSHDVTSRLRALEDTVAELSGAARDVRLRNAQLDVFLDKVRRTLPDPPGAEAVASIPDRDAFIELAVAELLDGPLELARERRASYLPVIESARGNGAMGAAFDMVPARGEWFEVLRGAEVEYRSASRNPLVVNHCAELGCELAVGDPLELLADVPKRSLCAVTGFRYVERLSPAELARFIDLAAVAIQPGGVLLIETPHEGGASAKDFHLDPFAWRPVHPNFLQFLAEAAGFAGIEVRYPESGPLSGWPEELSASAAERADRYCLLAWR